MTTGLPAIRDKLPPIEEEGQGAGWVTPGAKDTGAGWVTEGTSGSSASWVDEEGGLTPTQERLVRRQQAALGQIIIDETAAGNNPADVLDSTLIQNGKLIAEGGKYYYENTQQKVGSPSFEEKLFDVLQKAEHIPGLNVIFWAGDKLARADAAVYTAFSSLPRPQGPSWLERLMGLEDVPAQEKALAQMTLLEALKAGWRMDPNAITPGRFWLPDEMVDNPIPFITKTTGIKAGNFRFLFDMFAGPTTALGFLRAPRAVSIVGAPGRARAVALTRTGRGLKEALRLKFENKIAAEEWSRLNKLHVDGKWEPKSFAMKKGALTQQDVAEAMVSEARTWARSASEFEASKYMENVVRKRPALVEQPGLYIGGLRVVPYAKPFTYVPFPHYNPAYYLLSKSERLRNAEATVRRVTDVLRSTLTEAEKSIPFLTQMKRDARVYRQRLMRDGKKFLDNKFAKIPDPVRVAIGRFAGLVDEDERLIREYMGTTREKLWKDIPKEYRPFLDDMYGIAPQMYNLENAAGMPFEFRGNYFPSRWALTEAEWSRIQTLTDEGFRNLTRRERAAAIYNAPFRAQREHVSALGFYDYLRNVSRQHGGDAVLEKLVGKLDTRTGQFLDAGEFLEKRVAWDARQAWGARLEEHASAMAARHLQRLLELGTGTNAAELNEAAFKFLRPELSDHMAELTARTWSSMITRRLNIRRGAADIDYGAIAKIAEQIGEKIGTPEDLLTVVNQDRVAAGFNPYKQPRHIRETDIYSSLRNRGYQGDIPYKARALDPGEMEIFKRWTDPAQRRMAYQNIGELDRMDREIRGLAEQGHTWADAKKAKKIKRRMRRQLRKMTPDQQAVFFDGALNASASWNDFNRTYSLYEPFLRKIDPVISSRISQLRHASMGKARAPFGHQLVEMPVVAGLEELRGMVLPVTVVEDLQRSGKAISGFTPFQLDSIRRGVRWYQHALNFTKFSFTLPWPSFTFRNAYGDALQGFVESGIALFDPRHLAESMAVLLGSDGFVPVGRLGKLSPMQAETKAIQELGVLTTAREMLEYTGTDSARRFGAVNAVRKLASDSIPATAAKKVFRTFESMHEHRENFLRTASYLLFRKQGFSPWEAASRTNEIYFDYQALSGFARSLRNYFPFITWNMKNMNLQAKQMLRNPGRMSALFKAHEMSDFGPDEVMLPDYLRGELKIGMNNEPSRKLIESLGGTYTPGRSVYMTGIDTPQSAFADIVWPGSIEKLGKNWWSMLAPWKNFIEAYVFRKDVFTERDLGEPRRLHAAAQIVGNLPKPAREWFEYSERQDPMTGDTFTYVNAAKYHAWVTGMFLARFASTMERYAGFLDEEGVDAHRTLWEIMMAPLDPVSNPEAAADFFFGVRMRSFDVSQKQDRLIRENLRRLEREMRKRGSGYEFSITRTAPTQRVR